MSEQSLPRVVLVAGARPNFPKIAPVLRALDDGGRLHAVLVHTGQHYDPELSAQFFEDLGIRAPDWHLGAGSGTHAQQVAKMMVELEARLLESPARAVVVVGDVNSTVAGALVAAKLNIPVAHIEAGLRSRDRSMPEEVNRIVTDGLSDRLYTHCLEGDRNLLAEGVEPGRIVFVGNTMIDSLYRERGRAEAPALVATLGLEPRAFGLVTLHRPALVDHPERLMAMLRSLASVAERVPLLYPVHPRTLQRLHMAGALPSAVQAGQVGAFEGSRLWLTTPLRYRHFLWLMDRARIVLTDSGGLQEETTALGVPCLTARENTERGVTISEGTNKLVGLDPERLRVEAMEVLGRPFPRSTPRPPLWDGHAGERIARDLEHWLS